MKKNLSLFFCILIALVTSHVAHGMEHSSVLDEGKSEYSLRLIYNRNELYQIRPRELGLFSDNETLFCKISTKQTIAIVKSENPRIGLDPEIYHRFLGVLEDYVDPAYLQVAVMQEDERNQAIAQRFYDCAFETLENLDIEKLFQYTLMQGYTKKKSPVPQLSKESKNDIDSQKLQQIREEQEKIPLTKKRTTDQGNQEEQSEDIGEPSCCSSTCYECDKCCTHWGFKRWVYGIKEYIVDRCLCCALPYVLDPIDGDRAYIKENTHETKIVTTDCCFIAHVHNAEGWVDGTMCFPFAALTHLTCLPIACCYPTKDDWWGREAGSIEDCVTRHKERRKSEALKAQSTISRETGSYGTMPAGNHHGESI